MEISNFKYTLQINQKAIIDNKLDIDIIDASIFDFIHYFQSSPKTKKMVDNGTQYFYLHWSKIVEQIPLLGINSRQGVYKRLQNLINAKLIKAHEENGKGTGLMWFCLGENYDLMFVTNGNENYNLTTKVTQAVNESLQVNQKAVNESLHYNTISKKDNTISNTTSFENFQFSESEKDISLTDLKKGKEKSSAKKESDGLHKKMIEVYYEWFKNRNDGLPPKIDAESGKSVKSLIDYFKTVARAKYDGILDEEIPDKVLEIFNFILSKWNTLDAFTQKQVKLSQINSNITNILEYLRNGNKQADTKDYRKQSGANYLKGVGGELDAILNERFGGASNEFTSQATNDDSRFTDFTNL